jgi:CheY-like chemotaxis protein
MKTRVMAVDDSALILRLISQTLSQGYEVFTARDGPEALKALDEIKADARVFDFLNQRSRPLTRGFRDPLVLCMVADLTRSEAEWVIENALIPVWHIGLSASSENVHKSAGQNAPGFSNTG